MVAHLIVNVATLLIFACIVIADRRGWFHLKGSKEAVRYAVTLKHGEGAFIGLCIGKRMDRWIFVDVQLVPSNPGGPVQQAAPGELFVPPRNILYYQEIQETANVA